jgi:nucleoside-diphosphate-sugar epimerase
MTTSLVTGGAGFIGSHIVEALVKRGDTVRVLDNFSTGTMSNLSHLESEIEILRGDLRDPQVIANAVRDVDLVFHHAALISVAESMQKPLDCLDINVSGTYQLMDAAARAGVKRMLIASSAAVYGDSQKLPLKEDTELKPLSPYAASKQMDETLAGLYTRSFGLDVVCLRYFNVYGPRQNPDSPYAAAIPIFIRELKNGASPEIFGDGLQTRDFVFVADIVRANLMAMQHPAAPGKIFNICSGEKVTILEIIQTLSSLIPGSRKPVYKEPRSGEIYHSHGDPSQAKQILGFSPVTSLKDGLMQTIEWFC